jgi:signal transduction histidine kinase
MSAADALHASALFAGLPADELERLAGMVEPVELATGERLLAEGSPGDACFVIESGELEVTKRSGDTELPLAMIGPGAITGEMALLEDRPRNASVTATGAVRAWRIPRATLLEFLARPEAALAMLRTIVGRLRSTEGLLREQEKLAGLGTLAAGLAHELNNPAAAIRRSVSALETAIVRAETGTHVSAPSAQAALSALERSERIEALASLFDGDEETAASLADAGWTPETLTALSPDERRATAADAAVHGLIGEVRMAADRIGEIVSAVKGYAYLDQAPAQRIDVRTGLEQTLVILRHKLKHGIDVRREYADDLPEVEAYGSELNQVWTNLIDNAADAMGGVGELIIRAERDPGGGVLITICDSGPGIPPDVRSRLFEPFFTTKPPGKGTGLGLHISHNVIARHGGRIEVESAPGRTCFIVSLPERLPG